MNSDRKNEVPFDYFQNQEDVNDYLKYLLQHMNIIELIKFENEQNMQSVTKLLIVDNVNLAKVQKALEEIGLIPNVISGKHSSRLEINLVSVYKKMKQDVYNSIFPCIFAYVKSVGVDFDKIFSGRDPRFLAFQISWEGYFHNIPRLIMRVPKGKLEELKHIVKGLDFNYKPSLYGMSEDPFFENGACPYIYYFKDGRKSMAKLSLSKEFRQFEVESQLGKEEKLAEKRQLLSDLFKNVGIHQTELANIAGDYLADESINEFVASVKQKFDIKVFAKKDSCIKEFGFYLPEIIDLCKILFSEQLKKRPGPDRTRSK